MSAGDWAVLVLILAGEYLATGVGFMFIFRKLVRDTLADVEIEESMRAEVGDALLKMGGVRRMTVTTGLMWPAFLWVLIKVRRDAKRESGES
jgi:hypothetical protein